jgi:plasmid maintenance system antidote protein VapI
MKRKSWPKGTWMKLKSRALLQEMIKSRGMSYADVGRAAGCHRSMINALVNDHRDSCTPLLAERIALCLGVPVEALFMPRTSAVSGETIKRKAKAA